MKKALIIIISFFIFSPKIFASGHINSMNIDVYVDENGTASFKEVWQINNNDTAYFERHFSDVKDAVVSDIIITDANGHTLAYQEKFNNKMPFVHTFQDKKDTKIIKFTTDGKENTITIEYKVDGIITRFDDVDGLNWYFLSSSAQEIDTLNIYISGSIPFSETTTALYGIGNVSSLFNEGKIHLFASNVATNSKIKLLASFTDTKFIKHQTREGTLLQYYNKVASSSPFKLYIQNLFSHIIVVVILCLIIILVITHLIYKFIKGSHNKRYRNILSHIKEYKIPELKDIDYNDSIPCSGNIYQIYFIASYYNLIKSDSSLIGAILFNWLLKGIIAINEKDGKYQLILLKKDKINSELDKELYAILESSSVKQSIDNNKLHRYAITHSDEILAWYNKVVSVVLKETYENNQAIVKGKKTILTKENYQMALEIQSLKKYLLNFNQVPRKTRLTESNYHNSLVISVLLGIDNNLCEEILRKNPDNEKAMILSQFQKVKNIYKNIYSIAKDESKNKKRKKS